MLCIAVSYSLKLYVWPTSRGNVFLKTVLKNRNGGQTVVALLCSCTCVVSNFMHLVGKQVLLKSWPVQVILQINSLVEILSSETIVKVNCLNIQELDIYCNCTAQQEITIKSQSSWFDLISCFRSELLLRAVFQNCVPHGGQFSIVDQACYLHVLWCLCTCNAVLKGVCSCSEQHSNIPVIFTT